MNELSPWKVLLVDDEPGVHEVSRLILAGLTFEGRGIELLSAASAGQACELLARHTDVALALLDVVMESDDAGVRLVQHIRGARRDGDMQIVLRTGQPGMAPEGDLMREQEINGYVLKTEVTAQRLHSIVIGGLRAYRHVRSLRGEALEPEAARARSAADEALAQELAALDARAALVLQARPELALARHGCVGVEMLPRWRTSAGLLTAERVLALAPGSATLARLMRELVAQALGWMRAWARDGELASVSIPLASQALVEASLRQVLLDALDADRRQAGPLPGVLDLLVDEAQLRGEDPALRAAGLSLTLVDFGTGGLLLPRPGGAKPDRLKLPPRFVTGAARDPERSAQARSLIALSQTLGLCAIADGIASDEELQFFRWEGCELGQGELFGPACAPEALSLRRPRSGGAGAAGLH
ncbi:EAL domain-containing protein [Pelomonas sp. CA6]|uniref:EAL domain-containing response regulator n=1 Tax=Pelomonas sp. CA6 TaxID=2907999 RepID=UPI001F4B4194|nr:EAL domain-containing protein [Pelomonas sp. CA6]MCH7342736.1 EAL domain-containing protein [Pelomonas sp. CA6]